MASETLQSAIYGTSSLLLTLCDPSSAPQSIRSQLAQFLREANADLPSSASTVSANQPSLKEREQHELALQQQLAHVAASGGGGGGIAPGIDGPESWRTEFQDENTIVCGNERALRYTEKSKTFPDAGTANRAWRHLLQFICVSRLTAQLDDASGRQQHYSNSATNTEQNDDDGDNNSNNQSGDDAGNITGSSLAVGEDGNDEMSGETSIVSSHSVLSKELEEVQREQDNSEKLICRFLMIEPSNQRPVVHTSASACSHSCVNNNNNDISSKAKSSGSSSSGGVVVENSETELFYKAIWCRHPDQRVSMYINEKKRQWELQRQQRREERENRKRALLHQTMLKRNESPEPDVPAAGTTTISNSTTIDGVSTTAIDDDDDVIVNNSDNPQTAAAATTTTTSTTTVPSKGKRRAVRFDEDGTGARAAGNENGTAVDDADDDIKGESDKNEDNKGDEEDDDDDDDDELDFKVDEEELQRVRDGALRHRLTSHQRRLCLLLEQLALCVACIVCGHNFQCGSYLSLVNAVDLVYTRVLRMLHFFFDWNTAASAPIDYREHFMWTPLHPLEVIAARRSNGRVHLVPPDPLNVVYNPDVASRNASYSENRNNPRNWFRKNLSINHHQAKHRSSAAGDGASSTRSTLDCSFVSMHEMFMRLVSSYEATLFRMWAATPAPLHVMPLALLRTSLSHLLDSFAALSAEGNDTSSNNNSSNNNNNNTKNNNNTISAGGCTADPKMCDFMCTILGLKSLKYLHAGSALTSAQQHEHDLRVARSSRRAAAQHGGTRSVSSRSYFGSGEERRSSSSISMSRERSLSTASSLLPAIRGSSHYPYNSASRQQRSLDLYANASYFPTEYDDNDDDNDDAVSHQHHHHHHQHQSVFHAHTGSLSVFHAHTGSLSGSAGSGGTAGSAHFPPSGGSSSNMGGGGASTLSQNRNNGNNQNVLMINAGAAAAAAGGRRSESVAVDYYNNTQSRSMTRASMRNPMVSQHQPQQLPPLHLPTTSTSHLDVAGSSVGRDDYFFAPGSIERSRSRSAAAHQFLALQQQHQQRQQHQHQQAAASGVQRNLLGVLDNWAESYKGAVVPVVGNNNSNNNSSSSKVAPFLREASTYFPNSSSSNNNNNNSGVFLAAPSYHSSTQHQKQQQQQQRREEPLFAMPMQPYQPASVWQVSNRGNHEKNQYDHSHNRHHDDDDDDGNNNNSRSDVYAPSRDTTRCGTQIVPLLLTLYRDMRKAAKDVICYAHEDVNLGSTAATAGSNNGAYYNNDNNNNNNAEQQHDGRRGRALVPLRFHEQQQHGATHEQGHGRALWEEQTRKANIVKNNFNNNNWNNSLPNSSNSTASIHMSSHNNNMFPQRSGGGGGDSFFDRASSVASSTVDGFYFAGSQSRARETEKSEEEKRREREEKERRENQAKRSDAEFRMREQSARLQRWVSLAAELLTPWGDVNMPAYLTTFEKEKGASAAAAAAAYSHEQHQQKQQRHQEEKEDDDSTYQQGNHDDDDDYDDAGRAGRMSRADGTRPKAAAAAAAATITDTDYHRRGGYGDEKHTLIMHGEARRRTERKSMRDTLLESKYLVRCWFEQCWIARGASLSSSSSSTSSSAAAAAAQETFEGTAAAILFAPAAACRICLLAAIVADVVITPWQPDAQPNAAAAATRDGRDELPNLDDDCTEELLANRLKGAGVYESTIYNWLALNLGLGANFRSRDSADTTSGRNNNNNHNNRKNAAQGVADCASSVGKLPFEAAVEEMRMVGVTNATHLRMAILQKARLLVDRAKQRQDLLEHLHEDTSYDFDGVERWKQTEQPPQQHHEYEVMDEQEEFSPYG